VELRLAYKGSNKLSKIYDLQLPQCIHVYNKKLQRNISHVVTIMANQSPIIGIISYVLLQINNLNKIFKDRLHTNTLPNQSINQSIFSLWTKNLLDGLPNLPTKKRHWNSRVRSFPLTGTHNKRRYVAKTRISLNRVWIEMPNCYKFQSAELFVTPGLAQALSTNNTPWFRWIKQNVQDFWLLCSSGMLRSVGCCVVTAVSSQYIGYTF